MKLRTALLLLLLPCLVCAEEMARVEGTVRDSATGKSISGALVEIYRVSDYSLLINQTVTDDNGYYSFFVQPMAFYSVYVRFQGASDSFKTPEAVRPGSVNKINVAIKTGSQGIMGSVLEQAGFGLVIFASIIVLGLVIFGFINQNRKKGDSLMDMKRERDQIKMELELLRKKYHKREISEEALMSISKDKQERLIELESKMIALMKKR